MAVPPNELLTTLLCPEGRKTLKALDVMLTQRILDMFHYGSVPSELSNILLHGTQIPDALHASSAATRTPVNETGTGEFIRKSNGLIDNT